MNRFFKSFCIIALSTLILTSCSGKNNNVTSPTPLSSSSQVTVPQSTPTPSSSDLPSASSAAATATASTATKNATPGSINKFSDLFSIEHILDIRKASDTKFYNTSQLLLYTIADLLTKADKIDDNDPEDKAIASKFDRKKYDYVLQFDGAKPIFVSIKDSIVYFDGETEYYRLWADSKKLWDNITFDSNKKLADINEKGLEIQDKSFDSDINGDGKKEKISLVYKGGKGYDFRGDLLLRVENSDAVVLPQTQWQVNPKRTISQPPTVYFMPQKGSNNKILIVTLTWFAGSIQTSGDVFAYSYNNGKLTDLDLRAPQTVFKYTGGNTVTMEFPQMKSSQVVKFDQPAYERLIEKGKSLKDLFNDPNAFANSPLYFKLEDYDGDGINELCSMSTLMFESLGKMSMGFQYTFYKGSDNKLSPVKVIIAPPFIDEDKDVQIERFIMGLIFDYNHLTVINDEIKDSWYKPSNKYKKNEIASCINRMISENKLYKKGNNVYVKTN